VGADSTGTERRGTIAAEPADFRALAFFLDEVVNCKDEKRRRDIEVALVLSGDLHHYAHYARSDDGASSLPRHLITAGSGGAYTTATHHLRERLVLLDHGGRDTSYELRCRYPDRTQSSRLARGVYRLPFASPLFTMLVGLVYLFLMWQLQVQSRQDGRSMLEQMFDAPREAFIIYAWIPLRPFVLGVVTAVMGGVVGAWACACYFDWMAHRCKGALHMNDVFAAQRCEKYKCFLRMKLDDRGLTIYAVKCPTFLGGWKARVTGAAISPEATIWPSDPDGQGSLAASIQRHIRAFHATSWRQRLLKRDSWIRIDEAEAHELPPSRTRAEVAEVITIHG
jgi:hypothetical protein